MRDFDFHIFISTAFLIECVTSVLTNVNIVCCFFQSVFCTSVL